MEKKREGGDSQDREAGIWSVRERLTNSVKGKLSRLPPSSSGNCIYTVPDRLRKVNVEAFTPRLVSIGPLHRQLPHLQAMEERKLRWLKSFFDENVDILAIIDYIVREEENIRRHYQDNVKVRELSSADLSEMILLDSVFIVELFQMNWLHQKKLHPKKDNAGNHVVVVRKEPIDEIFDKPWMMSDLLHDMMLVENQIPLFVPHAIYTQFLEGLDFGKLIHEYMSTAETKAPCLPMQLFPTVPTGSPPRHLVEYLRMAHVPEAPESGPYTRRKWKPEYARSATELLEAGVTFTNGTEGQRWTKGQRLVEIEFEDGPLKIPQLKVNEWTETLFRNLIAFEQCERISPRYISDYIIFLDCLINTAKDVQVLIDSKIIENGLNDSQEVADLFNNLHKETMTDGRDFYFAPISKELDKYSKNWWHQWKAKWYKWKIILKRDYFSSPWTIISVIAAVVLLVLTVVQTACSIIGL